MPLTIRASSCQLRPCSGSSAIWRRSMLPATCARDTSTSGACDGGAEQETERNHTTQITEHHSSFGNQADVVKKVQAQGHEHAAEKSQWTLRKRKRERDNVVTKEDACD